MKRKRTSERKALLGRFGEVERLKDDLWRASEEIMRVQSQRDEAIKALDSSRVILMAIERLIRDWRGLA